MTARPPRTWSGRRQVPVQRSPGGLVARDVRKKLTPEQAFDQHMLTELPGLSVDHIGPLANVWHEATWHPRIVGQFTPEEMAQRFAARVQADQAAGRPYALALHAAGLDDLNLVGKAVDQADHAAASAIRFPRYVRLRLPDASAWSSSGGVSRTRRRRHG